MSKYEKKRAQKTLKRKPPTKKRNEEGPEECPKEGPEERVSTADQELHNN